MKRSIGLGTASLVVLAVLAGGCGGSGSGSEGQSSRKGPVVTTVASSDLRREGSLRVCVDVPSPPFAVLRGGRLTGFEVELVRVIARHVGLRPVWRDTPRVALVRDLLAGRCDIVAAQLAVSYALQSRIAMVPYLQVDQAFLVRRGDAARIGNPAADPEVLCGRALAVVIGSGEERTAHEFADRCRKNGKGPLRLARSTTARESLASLRTGQVYASFDDLPRVEWYAEHAEGVARAGGAIDHVNYGFGLQRHRDSLFFALRGGITSAQEDGTFARLQQRWGLDSSRMLALP